jgi:hypothetical protein
MCLPVSSFIYDKPYRLCKLKKYSGAVYARYAEFDILHCFVYDCLFGDAVSRPQTMPQQFALHTIHVQGDSIVSNQNPLKDIKINSNNLYREESITDLQAGTIKQMIPVLVDGSRDEGRPILFVGVTQIMSASGPLPIQCELPGTTLAEAIDAFPAEINKAVEKLIEEAKRMQREAASRIVVPGQEQAGKIIT